MVRRARLELAGARVDRLEDGSHAEGLAMPSHRRIGRARQARDPRVGQTQPLRGPQLVRAERRQRTVADRVRPLHHLCDLIDEPRIDRRGFRDLVHRVTREERRLDEEEPALRRGPHRVQRSGGRRAQIEPGLLQASPRLAERFLERPADRHHLADRLHRRRELGVRPRELLEREPRDLHHHVVERGLEGRRRLSRDVVRDLVQAVAHRQQRRDLRDREPGRLRRERRRARHARVHLDQDHAPVAWMDRELHVGAAGLDADRPDAAERRVAHGLILHVGQGLHRRHRDRVPGVHAHRVDVLDRADDDAVVVAVAHDLELELLPAGDRLLDQDLADR